MSMEKEKILSLIAALGFKKRQDGAFAKTYAEVGAQIAVNTDKGEIAYDKKMTLDKTTSNFSQPENFVVLECVDRLLTKGYRPEDLTLEKKWPLGRTGKSGKADIVVCGKDGKTLLIIECKTWGAEFYGERTKMEERGGQLFSYLQQDKNAKYLVLYSSRLSEDGEAEYRNAIVRTHDRPEDKTAYKEGDESVLLYQNANTVLELHKVWEEKFNSYFHYNGVFDDDANAYAPHLKPLTGKDLRPLSEADKLFNRFTEILRHHNISDNANAFNRILSLILCKIVDESKGGDEVLDFQAKEGEDNAEAIQDRLHALYKRGMERYLHEEIVYYEDDEVRQIIQKYPKHSPLEDIERMFREIKYYTNNEFSFKEVHNKQLFEKNARVLREVVNMLQYFRFRYETKEPVLGVFFELLLNHGVKQSQGQFFTPVPVVRFILDALGTGAMIDAKIRNGEEEFLPKTLDYACGAGHFLTEMMDAIRVHLDKLDEKRFNRKLRERIAEYKKSADWARDYIFGVEKDYRLARTAQIACFLHGDGEANIIFGDGLENHSRLAADGKFDIVAANPPYSVKAFKNYLEVGEQEYSLFAHLTEKSSEIETLFLERTAHALRPGGLAGVIFPVSILSNGGIYEKARQLLLENFELLGVAEMGGATFIATGTSTAILFLRRRANDYAKDRKSVAADVFTPHKYEYPGYINENKLLDGYAERRGFAPADYRTFVARNANAAVQKSAMWKDYDRAFNTDAETKRRKKTRDFLALSAAEQKAEMLRRFYNFALAREQERFALYMLCMRGIGYKKDGENIYETQTIAAAFSGTDIESQKAFLGYEFSGRRGQEGMNPLGEGKLDAVAARIRANIWGDSSAADDGNLGAHFKTVNLLDCIDLSGANANNAINLKIAAQIKIKSRWETAALGGHVNFLPKSNRPATDGKETGKYPFFTSSSVQKKFIDTADFNVRAVVIGDGGKSGVHIADKFSASNHNFVITTKTGLLVDYLYHWLSVNFGVITAGLKGANLPNIPQSYLQNIKLPLPPMRVQKKIVAECAAVDRETESVQKEIAELRREISRLIGEKKLVNLSELVVLSAKTIEPSESPEREFNYVGLEHLESHTGELAESARVAGAELKSAKRVFHKGNVLYGKLRPYLNKVHIAESGGVCSTDILVLETASPLFVKFALLDKRTQKQTAELTKGVNLPRIGVRDFLNIKIPALPDSKTAAKIAQADSRIAELRAHIASAPARKAAVLARWL